jgi:uncharacterized membrane protein YqhA
MAKEDSRYSPGPLPALICSSRRLQLPLHLGLIVAQGVHVDRIMGAGHKTAVAHRA